jgi:hypothetical protein
MNNMPEGMTESSYPPNMGLAEAKVSFHFRFSSVETANRFRMAIDSRISGLEVDASDDVVRINTDIDNFTSLKEKIDRIKSFVIGTTRPALQASLAS